MSKSKYIEFSTLSIGEFARSAVGTEIKMMLSTHPSARQEASKSIKSACTKYGSVCTIEGTSVLVEQESGAWLPTSLLTAVITERK